MMEDVRRGHINALVFSKLARLARNSRELMDFSDYFREFNADLVSLQENIDTSTPSGRLFYNMVAVMAQWEREEIVDRVKASVSIRAKLGKPLGGQASFGYTWIDKKLVPDQNEAPIRTLIYELFAQHGRKKTVSKILNDRGYRTRDGSKFSDTTIGRLLQDPTAKGEHRTNYTRQVGANKQWALKPEHEWVVNSVPAIVSPELWQKCNDMLEGRKSRRTQPAKRPVHVFAGLTFCSCGRKMYVPSRSPKYICSSCRNKIPIVDLEGIFMDELKNYLLSPDKVATYLAGAHGALAQRSDLVETLGRELQGVQTGADKVYDLYMAGGLSVAQFKERYQPLDERKKQIEKELPRAQAEVDLLKFDGLTAEHIMSEAQDLHARWPKMNTDERRKIVEYMVKDITIGDGEVTFNLCYSPSYEEVANGQRMLIDALPFCHLTIKAVKRTYPPLWICTQTIPAEPKTIGEHIKRERLLRQVFQKDLAKLFGVDIASIQNWERGSYPPAMRHVPKIVAWLGYDPLHP